MIALMYVQGINRVDTPYFSSEESRDKFFDNCVIWSDENSYYPPYYRNKIKISTDDISFSDTKKRVNYACIDYDSFRYYYFITSFDYVTDDLIEISIEMDTIQTFSFHMEMSKCHFSRLPIKRWGNDKVTINRNYVRENLSDGELRQTNKAELQYNDTLQWIVVRCTEQLSKDVYELGNINAYKGTKALYGDIIYKSGTKYSRYSQTGGMTLLLPWGKWIYDRSTITIKYGSTSVSAPISNIVGMLNLLASDNRVVSITYLPYDPFGISISKGSDFEDSIILTIPSESVAYYGQSYYFYYFDYLKLKTSDINNLCGLVLRFPWGAYASSGIPIGVKMNVKAQIEYFPFDVNVNKKIPYSSKYVPAMLDESYYRVIVGNNGTTTTMPLFYCTGSYAYIKYGVTLKGDRYYGVSFEKELIDNSFGDVIDDMHDVLVVDSNTIDYDLYTDPWKNYQVTHKGSMVTDWISTGANATRQGAWMASMTPKPTASASDYKTGFSMVDEYLQLRNLNYKLTGKYEGD